MNIVFFDPPGPLQHQYLTDMFFATLKAWLKDKQPCTWGIADNIHTCTGSVVILNADHLTPDVISGLRDNGNRIVGFSCIDSSYIAQPCREAENMKNVDLIFALTGLQTVNKGQEVVMTPDFKLELEDRTFLPEKDWEVFDSMRKSGRLQSLPYVQWEKQPSVSPRPYGERSQKAIIRGGHHMRRFLLCLELMKHELLDVNSTFYTAPYFADSMVPQFRYCGQCRSSFHSHGSFTLSGFACSPDCTNPHAKALNVSNLGEWNNRCPSSFFKLAQKLNAPMKQVEALLNGRWIRQEEYLSMLSRITFTSDLKWLFSIYAAQRFWDAAMAGCVNVLPSRTAEQEYFPDIQPDIHYLTYQEDMSKLGEEFAIDEKIYNYVSGNAREVYETWLRATDYAINTRLLQHIWKRVEEFCS